jgi:hypothetical protein
MLMYMNIMKRLLKFSIVIFFIAFASAEDQSVSEDDSGKSLVSAAIGFFGAILGATVGGGATYYIEKLKIKNLDVEKRKQAYSQLVGHKSMMQQLYIALGDNRIMAKYYELLEKSSQEQNMRQKADDIILEVARTSRQLFEIIGIIQILFPDTPCEKINRIEETHNKIISHIENAESCLEKMPEIELLSKAESAKKKFHGSVKCETDKGIDLLIDYLKQEIGKNTGLEKEA